MITRRHVVVGSISVSALLSTISFASFARGQSFPTGLVRMIVPFPPGGGTDALARVLGAQLQNLWGQSVVIDNRPGAAGVIGTRQVMTASIASREVSTNGPMGQKVSKDFERVKCCSAL